MIPSRKFREGVNPGAEHGAVSRRYDRMAWLYDAYDAPMELLGRPDGNAPGSLVGTEQNFRHYSAGVNGYGDRSSALVNTKLKPVARRVNQVPRRSPNKQRIADQDWSCP